MKADILFHVYCTQGRGLSTDFNTVLCVSCDSHTHGEAVLHVSLAAGFFGGRRVEEF